MFKGLFTLRCYPFLCVCWSGGLCNGFEDVRFTFWDAAFTRWLFTEDIYALYLWCVQVVIGDYAACGLLGCFRDSCVKFLL